MRRINVLKSLLSGWGHNYRVGRRVAPQRLEALDPLEARMLMAASIMSSNYLTFAVDVTQAGTYSVDVYQSLQQFSNKSITNLAVNAVVPSIPVVVHWATSPIEMPGGIAAASWNMNLAVGRNLVRVSKGCFTATLPANSAMPAAPSNLAWTVNNSQAIQLAWTDNSTNETGYLIERSVGNGNWIVLTTVAPGSTSFTDASVATGSQYSYAISAVNGANSSVTTNVAMAVVPGTPAIPAAPSALALTVQSSTSILLNWTDNSDNETGFVIERQTGSGSWNVLTTTGADVTSLTDTTAVPNTQYSYQVAATNSAGTSSASNVATATTPATIPAAPSSPTAKAITPGLIYLTWVDNSTNETGFVVERQTGSGSWTTLATTAAGATSYGDMSVTSSTQYSYRVSATDSAGTSSPSNVAMATTPALVTIPAAPSGLSATAVSSSQINLAWTVNSGNQTGFVIERQTGSGSWTTLTTAAAGATSYADTSVAASTQYSYRVSATDSAGTSSASNVATATTLAIVTVPAAPSGLSVTAAGTSSINLAWTDNATNETGYVIQRSGGASATYVTIATVGAGVISYSDTTGLLPGTAYTYRVAAVNGGGTSAYAGPASATTAVNLTFTNQSMASQNGTFTAEFDAVPTENNEDVVIGLSSGPATWYDAQATTVRFNQAGTIDAINGGAANYTALTTMAYQAGVSYHFRLVVNMATHTYDIYVTPQGSAAVLLGQTYAFRSTQSTVGTLDTWSECAGIGAAPVSNFAITASTPLSVPAAPSGLSATVISSSQVHLNWTDNSTNETGFQIERQTGGGSWILLTTTAAGATSYADTSVAAGTQYGYRVSATNGAGTSSASNVATATTLTGVTIPAAPSGLSATVVSSSQINLAWTDNSNNETGFLIERQTGGGSWTVLTTTAAGATSYADATVAASTQYSYRVSATNSAGTSSPSNVATATTLAVTTIPAAPSGLTATAVSSSQINLAWTDNANNETGFKIERKTGAGGTYVQIGTVGANVTSYSDSSGLSASTLYYYQIRATNAAGDSAYSNAASATTMAAGTTTYITPGSGWTGPTAQPAAIGQASQAMYTKNAIARWDVVPYQTFSGTFNVGVVAFDSAGIDHVAFSVNGGAWTNVSQMTANPQTANTSGVGNPDAGGVVEYWATLRASDFATDGQVEVRAIVYPTVGVPLVLQGAMQPAIQANGVESLFLYANAHGTLSAPVRYVSPTGNDANDGLTPQTAKMDPALALVSMATGGVIPAGATLYLLPGVTVWKQPGFPNNAAAQQAGGWVTIQAAPGYTQADVTVQTNTALNGQPYMMNLSRVCWRGVTFDGTLIPYLQNAGNQVWYDQVKLDGQDRFLQNDGFAYNESPGGRWITGSTLTNLKDGGQNFSFMRDVAISNTLTGGPWGTPCVINTTVVNADPGTTGAHPDIWRSTGPMSNVILLGLTTPVWNEQAASQGLILFNNFNYSDIAIVNCDVSAGGGVGADFVIGGVLTNVYVKDCIFRGSSYPGSGGSGYQGDGTVVFQNIQWEDYTTGNSVTAPVFPNATYR